MKPEEQRIAIAEVCGWRYDYPMLKFGLGHNKFWLLEDTICDDDELPDYLNDLNAMADAEKTFKNDAVLWHRYASLLDKDYVNQPYTIGATAAQRAEAFLKAIGKWTI